MFPTKSLNPIQKLKFKDLRQKSHTNLQIYTKIIMACPSQNQSISIVIRSLNFPSPMSDFLSIDLILRINFADFLLIYISVHRKIIRFCYK